MNEEYYADEDTFFTWLWEERFTQEERNEYAQEFEKKFKRFLAPGFVEF